MISSSKLVFLLILIFSFSCTSAVNNQNTTPPIPEDSRVDELKIKWNQMTGDINERIKVMEETLKENSKIFGIENLKQKTNSSDSEFRIWSDDEVFLHCLLISKKDEKWKASMLTGEIMVNRRTGNTYLKKTKSLMNLSPKSSWNEISNILFSKGIRFPFLYKIDEVNKPPEPDEGLVILEFNSEKQYGLAFYQKFSDSDDAKKIIELCKRLQDEFNVDLGC